MELKDYKLFCVFIVALKIIKKKEHLLFQEHEPQYRYILKGKMSDLFLYQESIFLVQGWSLTNQRLVKN